MIDFVVTSEEAGADKPASLILELALEKAGRKSGIIWMIGDDWKDIDSGRSIGAVTFLKVHDNGNGGQDDIGKRAVFTFKSFFEMIEILKNSRGDR